MDALKRIAQSRLAPPVAIAAIAALMRLLSGVYFANYDTLYALVWGQQLAHGQTPQYGIPDASTPHPLIEALGLVLAPLGPRTTEDIAVALGYLALGACGWVVYRLGREWFSAAAGVLAAAVLLTRIPIVSYGVRAYVDVPYMLAVLGAVLVEVRRPKAGAPVLILLGVAGLLRPEAWAFSGLYWLYLWRCSAPRRRVELALLAAAAPVLWVASDWLVTGHPLWSLTNTRHTARQLDRVTGIANVPQYIPRRLGEILGVPGLLGAAVGGVLSLLWLRGRALPGAIVGVVAVVVFGLFASVGLPINTRYAFLAGAILCVFLGAGVFGWTLLARDDPRRRWWMAAGGVVALVLVAYIPHQIDGLRSQLRSLDSQQTIQNDLVDLVGDRAISLDCGPVGVPYHSPIPLLALALKTRPSDVVNAAVAPISRGTFVTPATRAVEKSPYLDNPLDPRVPAANHPPAGLAPVAANPSWRVFRRCG